MLAILKDVRLLHPGVSFSAAFAMTIARFNCLFVEGGIWWTLSDKVKQVILEMGYEGMDPVREDEKEQLEVDSFLGSISEF